MTTHRGSFTAGRMGRWMLLLTAILSAVVLAAGCGGGKPGRREPASALDLQGENLERAQRLFLQLQQEHALRRDRQVLDLAFELLDRYPSFAGNEEALRLAVSSAQRLDDVSTGQRLASEYLAQHPDSPYVPEVLALTAHLAAAAGDGPAAAQALVRLHDQAHTDEERVAATHELESYLAALGGADLQRLYLDNHERSLGSHLGYRAVRAMLQEGSLVEAGELAKRLRRDAPGDPWTHAAARLLDAPVEELAAAGVIPGAVAPGRVGVLCPLTGRYAALGNAFYEGARLALEHVQQAAAGNPEVEVDLELTVEDSEADPVVAALAARRLCVQQGSVALVGAMLSATTATAALVCEHLGVPLVSPTATHDRLGELGAHVVQTNQTEAYEVELLAQLATRLMQKERFAVLYPRGREGEASLALFQRAVEPWGGRIVAAEGFPPEATDFREAIRQVRSARPEVIYVPAGYDQMILLGPQLDFYSVGAVIMGPSRWNLDRVVERTGASLQRALTVSEVAMFAADWTAEFRAAWDDSRYPAEATVLALRSYQATRSVLEELLLLPLPSRRDLLSDALQRRFSPRTFDAEGPEAFARSVRMAESGGTVPFPAELYAEAWARARAAIAGADSLGGPEAPADSVPRLSPRKDL
ncbi:MAG: ABC transporter substrate-binding protein [Candidatus Krumholzibacteriia bacterium]